MPRSAAPATALVTGASSGIGLYTALGLARADWRVVMIGRDPDRIERARRFVRRLSGTGQADVIREALVEPGPAARDPSLARRLWDESARLVGL